MVKVYVVFGQGIGCHEEVAHAFEKAGAKSEIIHVRQLLSGEKNIFDAQIINFPGGFWHGDRLGSAMSAANELEHAKIKINDKDRKVKELLLEYAEKGNVIYGQCNGFQYLVKTGMLPGIDNDYSKQTLTLTHNNCGIYRVTPVPHKIEKKEHFAFKGIDDSDLWFMCRHGEGKIVFYSDYGSVTKEEAEQNRKIVNEKHVLLRYKDPLTNEATEKFPWNPNGSIDGIAGLTNSNGNIIGHMAHPEVSIYKSRNLDFFKWKDVMKRNGIKAENLDEKMLEDVGLKVFKNIVNYVK